MELSDVEKVIAELNYQKQAGRLLDALSQYEFFFHLEPTNVYVFQTEAFMWKCSFVESQEAFQRVERVEKIPLKEIKFFGIPVNA